MKTVSACLCFSLFGGLMAFLTAQPPAKTPPVVFTPVVPYKPETAPQGTVVQKKAADLGRFAKPVHAPTVQRPRDVPGHSWRWHPLHGYVAIPVHLAPQVVVLPVNYALPAQVHYFEIAAAPAQAPCPHCGQILTIQLR